MFFDPLYLLIVGPAFLLSLVAQVSVKKAFSRFSQVGVAAHEAALALVRSEGIVINDAEAASARGLV